MKIEASRLLLDNTDHTFVTPVFNGSASLRDASGQLIESVTKSVRRKQTVDDDYMAKLYAETTALYRLDQGAAVGGKADLGPLPGTAVALLAALAGVWLLMGVYVLRETVKKRNGKRL